MWLVKLAFLKARVGGSLLPVFELLIDPPPPTRCPRSDIWLGNQGAFLQPTSGIGFGNFCLDVTSNPFLRSFFLTRCQKTNKSSEFEKNLPGPTRHPGHVSLRGTPLHCTVFHSFVFVVLGVFISLFVFVYLSVFIIYSEHCNVTESRAMQCTMYWWG